MILVVALNPALDVTHHVPGVDWAGVNRPAVIRSRPGGKGLNVARTLRAIGAEVQVIGLAGGVTGEQMVSALGELGAPACGGIRPAPGTPVAAGLVQGLVLGPPVGGAAAARGRARCRLGSRAGRRRVQPCRLRRGGGRGQGEPR